MRQLKYHEQKLLKKTDFLNYKSENNHRENKVLRKYHIQDRDDYTKYNKIVGQVTQLCNELSKLDSADPFRIQHTDMLLDKLYNMGLINVKNSLNEAQALTVSAMCRRRLPIVMCRVKMAETVKEAVTLIEQGHIRVGPDTVTDPAFLVTRNLEDFVTWVDTSKIKRHILQYNDKLDDYDLM